MNAKKIVNKLYDKNFRMHLRENPKESAKKLGYDLDASAQVSIVTNGKNKIYMIMPTGINEQILTDVQAGVKLGTAGTAGTAATISSFLTCLMTVGSIGSAGTAAGD